MSLQFKLNCIRGGFLPLCGPFLKRVTFRSGGSCKIQTALKPCGSVGVCLDPWRRVLLPGRRGSWTSWHVVETARSGCGSAAPSQTRGSAASHTPPSSPEKTPRRGDRWTVNGGWRGCFTELTRVSDANLTGTRHNAAFRWHEHDSETWSTMLGNKTKADESYYRSAFSLAEAYKISICCPTH